MYVWYVRGMLLMSMYVCMYVCGVFDMYVCNVSNAVWYFRGML